MSKVTFITGNQGKVDFLARWLGVELDHQKIELDELQSLDLHGIVEHKARQAYQILKCPVLVEDVGLTFHALGKLPGPFIKWFLSELSLQQLCELLPINADRAATSMVSYCLFDGEQVRFFDGSLQGNIPLLPRGNRGFGFDPIFVPNGSDHTHGEMSDEEIEHFGLRTTTVFPQLREYFKSIS